MEEQKKLPAIILVGIILISCVGILGVGIGSYFLVDNYFSDFVAYEETSRADASDVDAPGGSDEVIETPTIISPTATPLATRTPSQPRQNRIGADVFAPFWETRELLHDNFVIQPVDDTVLVAGAIEGLEYYLESYEVSLASVELSAEPEDIAQLATIGGTPVHVFDTYLPLWEAWSKLSDLELPDEANEVQLMRAALQGMMISLDDPYTNYLDPDLARQWDADLSGEYEGIGAWVDVNAEFLTIISPIPGSPAEAAGLEAGDRVLKINGEDMAGLDGNLVILQVLGPAGSAVDITFGRDLEDGTEEIFEVTIIRARIEIPNVVYELREDGVAYLQLITFSDTAHRDLADALEEMLANDPVGLILDLRGNGGGYLHSAVNITSEFIEEGVILYEEYGNGTRDVHEARTSEGLATEIPFIVLVDGGSASASEILAGAVQDYGRGLLVGTTTYGKGSVQVPVTLSNDAGTARITIAKWLTPNENHIQNIGLEPDVYVEYTEENALADEDPQLDKAVEILLGQ